MAAMLKAMRGLGEGGSAAASEQDPAQREYKFWRTQPVPQFGKPPRRSVCWRMGREAVGGDSGVGFPRCGVANTAPWTAPLPDESGESGEEGPFYADKPKEELRQTPIAINAKFKWDTLDINDDKQVGQALFLVGERPPR